LENYPYPSRILPERQNPALEAQEPLSRLAL
jgi:hypothetical protein